MRKLLPLFFLILFAAVSVHAYGVLPTTTSPLSGIVLYFHFNNDSSIGENNNLIVDSTGLNNGTPINTTFNATGGILSDGAYVFDGATSQVQVNNSASLNAANYSNITFAFAVSPRNWSSSANMYLFAKGATNQFSYSTMIGTVGKIRVLLHSITGGTHCDVTDNAVVVLNRMQDYLFTTNDTSCMIYRNGTLTASSARNFSLNMSVSTSNFTIGRRQDGAGIYANDTMDELIVLNRSVNSTEALALHNRYYACGSFINMTSTTTNTAIGGSGNINLSCLSQGLPTTVINNSAANIYDLYTALSVNSSVVNFNITSETLRLYSNNDSYASMTISSLNFNVYNSNIFSWNGSAVYNNLTNIAAYNRSYIYINSTANVTVYLSNISYLGFSKVNSITYYRTSGLTCEDCMRVLYNNNTFSWNIRAPYTIRASYMEFNNDSVQNNTGNGSSTPTGSTAFTTSNTVFTHNNVSGIYKGTGWTIDDAPALYWSTNSSNNAAQYNAVQNAETGITFYHNITNSIITDNIINNILGSGIKLEDYVDNVSILRNNISNCGDTLSGAFRQGIEINGAYSTGNGISNINISNNNVTNCVYPIFVNDASNIDITGNIIPNVTGKVSIASSAGTQSGAIALWAVSHVNISGNQLGNISKIYAYNFYNASYVNYYRESYNENNRTFGIINSSYWTFIDNDGSQFTIINLSGNIVLMSPVPINITNRNGSTVSIKSYFQNETFNTTITISTNGTTPSYPLFVSPSSAQQIISIYNYNAGQVSFNATVSVGNNTFYIAPLNISTITANSINISSSLTVNYTNMTLTINTSGITPSSPRLILADGMVQNPSYSYDNTTSLMTFNATIEPGTNLLYLAPFLSLSAYQLFTNASILTFNATVNGSRFVTTNGSIFMNVSLGGNTIQVDVPGNYSQNFTCTTTTVVSTNYCNATGIYDANVTVVANNGSANLESFTLSISNMSLGGTLYSQSVSGSSNIALLQGYYYVFNVSKTSYTSNSSNVLISSPVQLVNLTLHPITVNVLFLDEPSRNQLPVINISLGVIDATGTQTSYSTNTSTVTLSGTLPPGNYTFRYSADGYSIRDYYFILGTSDSIVNQTLYLINTSTYTPGIVEVRTSDGALVSSAIITLSRYYTDPTLPNIVEMGTSNLFGQRVMTLEPVTASYFWNVSVGGVVEYLSIVPESLSIAGDGLWHKTVILNASTVNHNLGFTPSFVSPTGDLVNGTAYNFTFNITSTVWSMTNCTLQLINESNGATLGSSSGWCSATSGTVTIPYNTDQGAYTINAIATISTSGFTNTYQLSYGVRSSTDESFTLLDALGDITNFHGSGFNGFDRFLLSVIVMIVVIGGLSERTDLIGSAEEVLVLVFLLTLFFSWIGWLTLSLPNIPVGLQPWIISILVGIITLTQVIRRYGGQQ